MISTIESICFHFVHLIIQNGLYFFLQFRYEYNEKRTPSYTDRILWHSADGMESNVMPFLYEPTPDFITSDHKPIRGAFAVKMNDR